MEKRIHLYVSKKHPALWLTGLLMLASVVARIAQFSQVEDTHVWRQIVWPSVAVMLFARKIHTDGKYHPTWKDRSDGRYIRSSPAIEQITPFIMPNGCGANILFDESVEISELDRYVRAKRREDMPNFGMTHAIVAAYVRTVAKYPALNRFVAGQRIYSRG